MMCYKNNNVLLFYEHCLVLFMQNGSLSDVKVVIFLSKIKIARAVCVKKVKFILIISFKAKPIEPQGVLMEKQVINKSYL